MQPFGHGKGRLKFRLLPRSRCSGFSFAKDTRLSSIQMDVATRSLQFNRRHGDH